MRRPTQNQTAPRLSLVADPQALLEEALLDLAGALAWLEARGIKTSRASLYRIRAEGKLPVIRARGRTKILYRPRDLARAFIEGEEKCRSNSSAAPRVRPITSAARSREQAFMRALAQATAASPRLSD